MGLLGIGFVSSSPIKPEYGSGDDLVYDEMGYGSGDEPKPYGCLPVRHCRVNGGVLCCTLNIDSDLTMQKGLSFSWTKPCYSKDKGWYQKEECEEEEEEEE